MAEPGRDPHWLLLFVYKQNTSYWGCLRHNLFANCIVKASEVCLENLESWDVSGCSFTTVLIYPNW